MIGIQLLCTSTTVLSSSYLEIRSESVLQPYLIHIYIIFMNGMCFRTCIYFNSHLLPSNFTFKEFELIRFITFTLCSIRVAEPSLRKHM